MHLNELEFEEALCRCYTILLPDLAMQGFYIFSRQAVMHGRRLDLVLRNNDGRTIITELKVGNPNIEDVISQLSDYKNCFEKTYPDTPLSLMLISNRINDKTRREFEKRDIQAREICDEEVMNALKMVNQPSQVAQGLHMEGENVMEIRRMLSDFNIVTIPPDVQLASPWDQTKVFLGLVKRGEKHKDLWMKDIYVQLYPQLANAAVLYRIGRHYDRAPLHLNPRSRGWCEEVYEKMKPFIQFVQRDNKGPGRESMNFDHYRVLDWDGLAGALGL